MALPLPLPARALLRRALNTPAQKLCSASVFPCFNGEGVVLWHVIVPGEGGRLWALRHTPGCLRVPLLGRTIRCRDLLHEISDANDARAFAGLWHYDPAWLLLQERYAPHPAAPILRATNCVDRLGPHVRDLYFGRDLARLRWIMFQDSGQQTMRPLQPEMLPPAAAAVTKPASSFGGWRFDPIWTRWGRLPNPPPRGAAAPEPNAESETEPSDSEDGSKSEVAPESEATGSPSE